MQIGLFGVLKAASRVVNLCSPGKELGKETTMNTAKKNDARNPLEMTLAELLKEYGPPGERGKGDSGTHRRVTVDEELLPVPPPAPKKELSAKTVTVGGEKFFQLTEPGYNHRFVRYWIPLTLGPLGKRWAWNEKTRTRLVPQEDVELMVRAMKECYPGKAFTVDGRVVK